MADRVQLKVGADLGGAMAALAQLRQAATGAVEPVTQLKTAFADAAASAQRNGAAALAAFKADMQAMVAQRTISSQQALGFDLEYTAQRSGAERAALEETLAADAATLAERSATYSELVQLSGRYSQQFAEDQRRIADAARREADQLARPYRQAFDQIGAGWRSALTGLIEGTTSFRDAALEASRSVERGFVSMAQTTLSRSAAGPLAALLGTGAPGAGDGVGDVLGNAASGWLFGAPQQLGQAAATTANTAAITANTAALGTLVASLGATSAAGGATALAGGGAAAGAAAGGGGLFGWLGGLFAFAGGGIVPSAAGGWALPNFAGATPALLHSREMVLPAPISEGLQGMIAQGGRGGDMHLHFHGPSDGPSVERWFSGLMARSPGTVRNMLRSNALTPRGL
ncbi:MAG: hypothetical protein JO001_23135 [Alphaproteobacteria bacterium]|nr:hypothetical protein [Alphaproteobacteria bacterium]